ncbi:MAG: 23S rRNA (adenine(2503)-C(2))-methyltransferase RlmN [Acidobacteria bacterium]|nr:23S rRNA (adenine(2503)-C(2))-methyltransferase RlmN [Acidobacteriota bacterium]
MPTKMRGTGGDSAVNLFGADRERLAGILAPLSARPFHARQLYRWIYARRATDFALMSDLPANVRETLSATCRVTWPEIASVRESADGSRKYLLTFDDGRQIEAVYILYGERVTLCLSSQVGCPLACSFCLTGTMGLVRNMNAGEIVGQVATIATDRGIEPSRVRIVFMGMGEPLNNYDAVLSAFRILVDRDGFAIPPRRVTLSTAGLVPGIERLAGEVPRPRLAISLAASNDEMRNDLIPINRKYPLASLMKACRRYPLGPRDRVTFEYVLLAGVNDADADADRIARLVRGIRNKVNIIPYNETGIAELRTPPEEGAARFRARLERCGVLSTIRWSKGRDIGAACGQLVVRT